MRILKLLSLIIIVGLMIQPEILLAADIPNIGGGDGKAQAEKTAKYVIGFLTFVGIIIAAVFGTLGAIKVSKDDDSGWKTIQSAGIGAVLSIIIGGVVIGMVS